MAFSVLWQPALGGIGGPRNADPGALHVRCIHLAGRRRLAGVGGVVGQETSEWECLKAEAFGVAMSKGPINIRLA